MVKFPPDLKKAYGLTWQRIEEQPHQTHVKRAKEVLLWVTFAEKDLAIRDLRDLLATSPEGEYDPGRAPTEAFIVSVCCGLVELDKESGLVRLIRTSTQVGFGK